MSADLFSLQGKTILLTGGAGLYGRGLAAMLAQTGANLILAARDVTKLRVVADEENAKGNQVTAESLDQGDEASVLALAERVHARFGPLHGLVNNAVLRPMKGANGAAEQFAESMRVNATGVMLMHRHFGKPMAEAGRGSIVNIGSIQGMIGPSYELYTGTNMGDMPPDYFFHKGGMVNLTRFYAALYGPKNVRVNCLAPGGFFNHQPEPFLERYCDHTMLGRMADDTDLGGAVIFLLSDASRYITGVNLPVDGGYTAK
ncbi:SDR family oxidoreductase [Prosthecobacter sp.]|uniref:SDR family oxidoreductase n=1 Tax=Prosthecobacter sp. TaxID=1965333 RepID=UPI001D59034F|nr:SDR family oxidoreductase [Prosthecobacter sp.]MCB1276601.1 SDR family oxidoreductase [Prosthecobacter sp.]